MTFPAILNDARAAGVTLWVPRLYQATALLGRALVHSCTQVSIACQSRRFSRAATRWAHFVSSSSSSHSMRPSSGLLGVGLRSTSHSTGRAKLRLCPSPMPNVVSPTNRPTAYSNLNRHAEAFDAYRRAENRSAVCLCLEQPGDCP